MTPWRPAPPLFQVGVKWVQYALGLEDCAAPSAPKGRGSAVASVDAIAPDISLSPPPVRPAPAPPLPLRSGPRGGAWEPFGYAPFSPYGPQCVHVRGTGH